MGLAEDIRDYLTTGGVTASIFIGELPDRPTTALVVTPTGGLGPEPTFSGLKASAPLENLRVQLRSRSDSYATAESNLLTAHALLSNMGPRLINGRRYLYGRPVQAPFYLGQDDAGLLVFACNYSVDRAESTS